MLRDHHDGRDKYNNNFTLSNVVRIFGEDTEHEEIKVQLRPIYKELRAGVGSNKKDIEGVISDQRFFQIIDIVYNLLEEYYIKHRFE
ncbi:hypothetical protein U9K52_09820 [Chryseobacterium sp. MHB01]|uniref:hypothetical protein n=1 Tax=Chryseobacterium sp. MHB01 TaxID=3109433 RepID=UPI002AFE65F3|nr:hypothetical protein [Chryseobacterium sp. MHB01]MEA1849209.1 hypothetical protein [Chryseobacterium sp. MHB01]